MNLGYQIHVVQSVQMVPLENKCRSTNADFREQYQNNEVETIANFVLSFEHCEFPICSGASFRMVEKISSI